MRQSVMYVHTLNSRSWDLINDDVDSVDIKGSGGVNNAKEQSAHSIKIQKKMKF